MTGVEFENWCIKILQFDGYTNIAGTKTSGDFGADIIAYKDGKRYAFQCKCYSKAVGVKAVQEVIGARAFYNANVGVVITNSTFSTPAIRLANASGVLLMDGAYCDNLFKRYKAYYDTNANSYKGVIKQKKSTEFTSLERFSGWLITFSLIGLVLFCIAKVTIETNNARAKQNTKLEPIIETTAETEIKTEIENDLSSEYIFPYSDTILLTEEDIAGMNKKEIQLAINEIYARAGREFGGDNGKYFRTKSWYCPQYDKDYFNAHQYELLNDVEQANITFLIKYR